MKISHGEDTLWTRFESVCGKHPDHVAIESTRQTLIYQQLWNRVECLSRTLADGECTLPIAISCGEVSSTITGMIASFRVGRPFLILNDQLPLTRNRAILEKSGTGVLLTDRDRIKEVQSWDNLSCPVRCIEESANGTGILPKTPIPHYDSPACIIYTSGTTQGPRGVLHSHGSLMHALQTHTRALSIVEEDRLSLITSISHMAGVMDILRSVLNGATLVPFDLRTEGLGRFAEYLDREKVTVLHTSPAVFRAIVGTIDCRRRCIQHVRIVHVGGDAVSRKDVENFKKYFPISCVLSCGYGGTEMGPVSRTLVEHDEPLSISFACGGHVFEGKKVVITDSNGRPVAMGERGEIRVQSRFLAEGYWNDPTSTAQKFTMVDKGSGEREYRTGDVGYISEDGCLVCCGRLDNEVKIDGYRLNTNEIEIALLRCQGVAQAAVLAEPYSGSEECQLVAYLSIPSLPRDNDVLTRIRSFLREYLPEYMIPSEFVILHELPKTRSGKIDRRSLIETTRASSQRTRELGRGRLYDSLAFPLTGNGKGERDDIYTGPGTHSDQKRHAVELERNRLETTARMIEVFEDALEIDSVGDDDNFFDLGGNSLRGIELVLKVEEVFGVRLPFKTLLEAPTAGQLTLKLRDNRSDVTYFTLSPVNPECSALPIFCIHGLFLYRELAYYLGPNQPTYGIYVEEEVDVQREKIQSQAVLPFPTVEALAGRYRKEIRAVQSEGPYQIAGESFGGLVAFEIAQQLIQECEQVSLLALFDTNVPRLSSISYTHRVHNYMRDIRKMVKRGAPQFVKFWQQQAGSRSDRRHPRHLVSRMYKIRPFPGQIVLFRALESNWSGGNRPEDLGWGAYAKEGVVVHEIPGDHLGILKNPNVETLAQKLDAYLL